ncbi:hypothetical protein SAMN05421767_10940 [Granulicatella balaenopterae]|uniref:Uncharacterized protein n=1 Tax=Granulicatella balaenopterae TaxID=137733 RepID=A0A1H9JLA9_9LACT|nr:hypothetical protein SAMN05421767_10940 [Granulicatella balaenopterae]
MYFLAEKQKVTANVVIEPLGNASSDLKSFILVTPKSENDVRLQVTLDNQNSMGLPVGTVREKVKTKQLIQKKVK